MTTFELDPIKYELFHNKLEHIVNEGKEIIQRLSGSIITRESGEVLSAFYLPDTGEGVVLACGILMHAMNIPRVIKYMYENKYAEDIGIREGDMFINNDAYLGGMHVPDTGLIEPIYYKGELIGWVAGLSHTTETGGIEPGGMCPSATESYHDGLTLPVVKIIDQGVMRRDILNMILRAVRDPRAVEMDIRARIAGNTRIKKRILEVVDEFGPDFFQAACRKIVDDCADQARAKIKLLNPGVYRSRTFSDNFRSMVNKLAVIELEMEVKESGEIEFRAPVVSPQVACFDNAYLPCVEATIFYSLLVQLFYDTRWNTGIARVVDFKMPEHSRLNADSNMSVGYATVGIGSVFSEAISGALGRAFYASGNYEDIMLGGSPVSLPVIAGLNQFGTPFAQMLLSACVSGSGARIGKDGHDTPFLVYTPNFTVADIEGEEMLTPVVQLKNGFRPDSSGYGKYRGGSGNDLIFAIHGSDQAIVAGFGTGYRLPANQGLFGGYPGAAVYLDTLTSSDFQKAIEEETKEVPFEQPDIKNMLNGNYQEGPPSQSATPMKQNDIIILANTGGAGIGDPLERDPQWVARDVENGLSTVSEVCKAYGVVLNDDLTVDKIATNNLRQERIQQRLSQGIQGIEYVKQLVTGRQQRAFSVPVLEFFDELVKFSPGFQEELAREEELALKGLNDYPPKLNNLNNTELLYHLTHYIDVVRNSEGKKYLVCNECGHLYCESAEDYKLYALVFDNDPHNVRTGKAAHDKDWCVYREFYCPDCGRQIEVEAVPPVAPIIANYLFAK